MRCQPGCTAEEGIEPASPTQAPQAAWRQCCKAQEPHCSKHLQREFEAQAPNQKWVADFTYIWTAEGWLYAAAVMDLYSRRIVGWFMSDTMQARMVSDALLMAL